MYGRTVRFVKINGFLKVDFGWFLERVAFFVCVGIDIGRKGNERGKISISYLSCNSNPFYVCLYAFSSFFDWFC